MQVSVFSRHFSIGVILHSACSLHWIYGSACDGGRIKKAWLCRECSLAVRITVDPAKRHCKITRADTLIKTEFKQRGEYLCFPLEKVSLSRSFALLQDSLM
jgi:hypothetical protein